MKSSIHRISSSVSHSFRQAAPILLAVLVLFLADRKAEARGAVAVRGPHGGGAVAVRGGYGGRAVAVRGAGYGGVTAVAVRPGLPRGYVATIPGGYRRVVYGGYNCYFVGGVYYRPEFYEGTTVYVIVP